MARDDAGGKSRPGVESVEGMLRGSARVQQRSIDVAQDWFTGLLSSLQDQAESYADVLRALDASLTAVKKALESQAEASRALQKTLEASQRGIANAASAQERNLELVRSLFGGMLEISKLQLDVLRAAVPGGSLPAGQPVAAQAEALGRMTQEWIDAYTRVLESSMSFLPSRSKGETSAE